MKNIFFLAAGMFTMGCDNFVVICLLPGISASLGTTIAAASQGVTSFGIAYAVSAPLFAVLLARNPARFTLTTALGVFFLGNLLTILAPSLPLYLIGRAISGVGAGLFSPLAAPTATQLVNPEKRGRALGLLWGANGAGSVLGGPLGLFLAGLGGWRVGFLLIMGFGLLAMAGIALFLPRLQVGAPPNLKERILALGDSRVLKVIGVTFLTTAASLGLFTFAAPLSEGSAGTVAQAIWFWSIGGLVGSNAIGYLVDYTRKPRVVMALVMGTLALALLSIPLLRSVPYFFLAPFFVWGMAGWATVTPQQHTLFGLQAEHRAALAALNGSAVSLGGALGSSAGALALTQGLSALHLPFAATLLILLALAGQITLIRSNP